MKPVAAAQVRPTDLCATCLAPGRPEKDNPVVYDPQQRLPVHQSHLNSLLARPAPARATAAT